MSHDHQPEKSLGVCEVCNFLPISIQKYALDLCDLCSKTTWPTMLQIRYLRELAESNACNASALDSIAIELRELNVTRDIRG